MVAITEQTKNASKSARSVNSILASLAQILDDGSSNGKKIVAIFQELGVEMYDTNGQMKDGYDLLEGLYQKWGDLDGNTQKYIATTIAGTTQLNGFLALMNNFDHAIGATETALNSQGSAMQENSAYMDSLEARLAKLHSTFQSFANNVISSDLAKFILGVADALLQLANTPIGQFVTQILLLTGIGWGATSLVNAMGIFKVAAAQFAAFIPILKNLWMTMNGVQGATLAVGSAFSFALPIALAFAAVLAVGGAVWKATEDYRKSVDELNSELDTNKSKLEQNKERLNEINSIAWNERTPDIVKEKEAIEKENIALQEQIDKLSKLADKKTLKEAKNTLKAGTITEEKIGVTSISGVYASAMSELEGKGFDTYDKLISYLDNLIPGAAKKTKAELEALGVAFGNVRTEVNLTGQEYENALINKASDLVKVLNKNHELNDAQVQDYEEITGKLKEVADAHEILGDESEQAQQALDLLVGTFEDYSAQAEFAANHTEIASDAVNNLKSKYPELASAIENVNGVNYLNVESLEAVKFATEEDVRAAYDAIAALTVFQNTQLDLSQQVNELYKLGTALGVAQAELNAFKAGQGQAGSIDYIMQEAALSGKPITRKEAEQQYTQSVWNRWKVITDVKPKVTVKTPTSVSAPSGTGASKRTTGSSSADTKKEETAEEKLEKAIKAANDAYKEQISILKNRMYILEQQEPDDPTADVESLNKYKDIQNQKIAYYKEMQQKTHELAEQYRKLGIKEESSTMTELGKQWWEYQKNIKEVYANISDYSQKFHDKLKQQTEEANKKAIEAAEAERDARKEILEKEKSDYEVAISYVISKIEDEINKLQTLRDETEQYWDDKIQAVQDANEALDEQIEREELLNALEQAKSKTLYVFKDGQFQYVRDTEAIAEAQANLDAYDRQRALEQEVANLEKSKDAALKAIDEQIEGWNKYKDEWSKVTTQYTDQQNKLIAEQVLGVDLEQKNWEKRLANVQEFADKYNAILTTLNTLQNGIIGEADYLAPSGDGASGMSDADAKALAKAGEDYNNAKTDAERNAAHARAEAIRAKYGYSGGATGSEYIPIKSSGSSSSSSSSGLRGTYKSSSGTLTSSTSTTKTSSSSNPSQDIGGRATNRGKYAIGTLNARSGLSLVGEKGPELRVLNSGDGILPNNITKNLWDWGKLNPSQFSSGNNYSFAVDNVTLPNVKNAEEFVSGLKQLAYQRAYKRV